MDSEALDEFTEKVPVATLAGPETWPPVDGDLGFHYNRAERLKNAPKMVREYYDGTNTLTPPRGFKVLVANKMNRFMLIAVLITVGVLFALQLFGKKDYAGTLAGMSCELSAFRFEDKIYVSLSVKEDSYEKSKRKGEFSPKTVFVKFSAMNTDEQYADFSENSIVFSGTEDFLRTTFSDYDIISVSAELSCNQEVLELKSKIIDR